MYINKYIEREKNFIYECSEFIIPRVAVLFVNKKISTRGFVYIY